MQYWLFKTDPDTFCIDNLYSTLVQTGDWNSIRIFQARYFSRDDVKLGDQVLIYHSSCRDLGIVGLADVTNKEYPAQTQFDPVFKYYDLKSPIDDPRWVIVDVQFKQRFKQTLVLKVIKQMTNDQQVELVKKEHRLSIIPVQKMSLNYY